MKTLSFISLFIVTISCANNSTTTEQDKIVPSDTSKTNSDNAIESSMQDVTGCYMKITGRDTAILMLEQKGKNLSGKMLYDNYEKDGATEL